MTFMRSYEGGEWSREEPTKGLVKGCGLSELFGGLLYSESEWDLSSQMHGTSLAGRMDRRSSPRKQQTCCRTSRGTLYLCMLLERNTDVHGSFIGKKGNGRGERRAGSPDRR